MKICKNCVLNENFPRITFSKEGICNYCLSSQKPELKTTQIDKYEKRFLKLVSEIKGRFEYDCLVAFSGGKDSTYTLDLIKSEYGLHPLAFSYDNWFQAERTSQNIHNVIKHFGIDHLTILPNYDAFTKIIRAAISQNPCSPKALERASTICTICLSLIRFAGYKIAIEKQIPILVFGLSPGQAPIVTSIFKSNPDMIQSMQDVIYKPLFLHLGSVIDSLFLNETHFKQKDAFPYVVNPLAFSDYDESLILKRVKEYGWARPEDTDANSSNCLLNALANQEHMERLGYNPYASEIAEFVRYGKMTRKEGLRRLSEPIPENLIQDIKKKLRI